MKTYKSPFHASKIINEPLIKCYRFVWKYNWGKDRSKSIKSLVHLIKKDRREKFHMIYDNYGV